MKVWLWCMFFFCSQTIAQPSIAFFYGKQPPLLELCMYDLVVVDPKAQFNPHDCEAVSLPLAYVSVGEVAKDATDLKNIPPTWVIGTNHAWNDNKIIDQSNLAWQSYFIDQHITPLWSKGYRGFFLDTLDSYQLAIQDPLLQDKQKKGLIHLIQQIKHRYPDAKIILNRGFHLLPEVRPQIDAVVIESLYHAWNQGMQHYELTSIAAQQFLFKEITRLKQLQLPIIVIDYIPPKEQDKAPVLYAQIAQQGLTPWITDKQLSSFYIQKIKAINRKILVLFSSEDHLSAQFIPVLRYVSTILEYMGYVPEYINLTDQQSLPSAPLNNHYAGILLWLETQNQVHIALLDWVQAQIKQHVPVVFLNGFGVANDSHQLAQLGLVSSVANDSIKTLEISKLDPKMIGYDIQPIRTPYYFYPLKAEHSRVLLQLQNEYKQTQDAVAITPWGGYAINPYVIQFLPNYYALWVINPFDFLSKALRLDDYPIPDTTTENGLRLMSVHIDGDGFANQAKWIGGRVAAEELRDLVLKQFPIPTSLSVITGEIAPDGIYPKESPQLVNIAKSIFALPYVEIASHSFSHPFNWQTRSYKKEDQHTIEPYVFHIPHYHFNLEHEISGSIDYINQYLAPANKKVRVFFWSGLANPSVEAMNIIDKNHVLNINGLSDTEIDKHHPAITGIRPMGMRVGEHYQVFAPIQMDFYYMNQFAGPMYGYQNVIQTFELTDKPKRMKPIDLYFHIYAASYPGSLEALLKVYRWALKQPVMNIYISDYIKKVLDYNDISIGHVLDASFQTIDLAAPQGPTICSQDLSILPRVQNDCTKIDEHGPRKQIAQHSNESWRIVSNTDLRELRSSRHLGYPDLVHSQNIIGFKENKTDLYIHLGPKRLSILHYQATKPTEPYLVTANARVDAFYRHEHQLDISFKGYMPITFSLDNIATCKVSSATPLSVKTNADHTSTYSSREVSLEIHIIC